LATIKRNITIISITRSLQNKPRKLKDYLLNNNWKLGISEVSVSKLTYTDPQLILMTRDYSTTRTLYPCRTDRSKINWPA